jgi:hypothetical protein
LHWKHHQLAGGTQPWEVEYRLQLAGKSNPFTTNRYFDFGLVAVFSILESGRCGGRKVLSSTEFSGRRLIKTIKQNSVLRQSKAHSIHFF